MRKIELIKHYVEAEMDLDITKQNRRTHYVRARSIYYELCLRFVPTASLSEVGNPVNKDHATILHARKNFERDILNDERYFEIYKKIYNILSELHKLEKEQAYGLSINELDYIETKSKNKELQDLLNQKAIEMESLKLSGVNLDRVQKKLLVAFEELSDQGKLDAMFKIEVMAKVEKSMLEKSIRKIA